MNHSAARSPGLREYVVLVDDQGRELGTTLKMAAHLEGALHRAVSAFVLDRSGNVLLQRRAAAKYHSGGLWSNACCTHPLPGEQPGVAAHRRLVEEMGIDCSLSEVGTLLYRAELENGLIEHEYDHLFLGTFDGIPAPDPAEVAEWRWMGYRELVRNVAAEPERYTAWFGLALGRLSWGGHLPTT